MIDWVPADWPAPASIRAGTTGRSGGLSQKGWSSLNLATHVGDDSQAVAGNRRLLREALALPAEPCWLEQVHGTTVLDLDADMPEFPVEADAAFTRQSGVVCAVLTADCLPLLMTDAGGTTVAAVHAGWRGLQAGIVQRAVSEMRVPSRDLLVWLGPAIGQQAFEVGEEVRETFVQSDPECESAFLQQDQGKWLADLYALARILLRGMGVQQIYGGDHCSYAEPQRFYSYRRERQCGRMASLIWRC